MDGNFQSMTDFQSSIKSVARAQAAHGDSLQTNQQWQSMVFPCLPYRKGSTYKWSNGGVSKYVLVYWKGKNLQFLDKPCTQWPPNGTPKPLISFSPRKHILKNVSQPRPATCQCFAGQQKLGVQTLQWKCQRFSSQRWPLSVQRGLQKAAGYHSHQIPRFHRF